MLSNKKIPISISQLDKYDVISINFQEGKIIKRNKYKPTHSATKLKDHCAKDVGDLLREATSLIPDVLAALGKEDNARPTYHPKEDNARPTYHPNIPA